jgi:hypothetical protein
MEIFYLRFNTGKVQELMAVLNNKLFCCNCSACFETKRCEDPPFGQLTANVCIFTPNWENILKKYNISFEYRMIAEETEDSVLAEITDPLMGVRLSNVRSDLVNFGQDEFWRNVAYGKSLSKRDCKPFSESREKIRFLFRHPFFARFVCVLVMMWRAHSILDDISLAYQQDTEEAATDDSMDEPHED